MIAVIGQNCDGILVRNKRLDASIARLRAERIPDFFLTIYIYIKRKEGWGDRFEINYSLFLISSVDPIPLIIRSDAPVNTKLWTG